jgi:hypothetical protein
MHEGLIGSNHVLLSGEKTALKTLSFRAIELTAELFPDIHRVYLCTRNARSERGCLLPRIVANSLRLV